MPVRYPVRYHREFARSESFRQSKRHEGYLRRVRKLGNEHEDFELREIFDRDGWQCQLCGQPVDREAKWPHPEFPTLDHIVPVSKGGGHLRSNVQCAHLHCNLVKHVK